MKDSIYGLSLGTLVRQMMCGIVFFIPIVLWKEGSDWGSLIDWLQRWNATGLIAFGVVAACIGTIIYHIEKNFWAYFWQWVRTFSWGSVIQSLSSAGLCVVSMFLLCNDSNKTVFTISIVLWFFILVQPILMPFVIHLSSLVNNNRSVWMAASKLPDDFVLSLEKGNKVLLPQLIKLYELKEISRREAGWADYIHCGQTSALAWILGCCVVCCNSAPFNVLFNSASEIPAWVAPSVEISIWVLGFEMICEVHKQRHINKLLDDYEKLKTKIEIEKE